MKKYFIFLLAALAFVGCKQTKNDNDDPKKPVADKPDWYYSGGELGTSYVFSSSCFEQPTKAVEDGGFYASFKRGEALFEKQFMSNPTGTRGGLGPVYVRQSCFHCHPGYGHGKTVPSGTYNSSEIGNGTLLVVYNPETEAYVPWVAGMPQLHAVEPFKAPVDGSKITIEWQHATDTWGNTFPDGETYELVYPIVHAPKEAFYASKVMDLGNYEVRLENTIGIYGTGLTDAIPDDSITAQWAREEQAFLNGYLPHWKTAWFEGGQWKADNGAYYSNKVQGDGTPYVRRYTYAMSRGPILDAAGANAVWNITNVTRSDRRYHYLDLGGTNYAKQSSQDPEVQAGWPEYIARLIEADDAYREYNTGDVEADIYNYLTSKNLPAEMTDQEYADIMVWHRGLAVPAVRNHTDSSVIRGRELFNQVGCAQCHRPSWKTGDDRLQDPAKFFTKESEMPHYANQTIWPYTDFVQHKLMMEHDIRTGWCRTTPLWGRGLHQKATGDVTAARLHDTRARNTLEAIMWHAQGGEQSDAYSSVSKFRQLTKKEREDLCAFVDAI